MGHLSITHSEAFWNLRKLEEDIAIPSDITAFWCSASYTTPSQHHYFTTFLDYGFMDS